MKEWFDKWIVANWGTKVMAMGLALLLWMYLYEESEESTDTKSFAVIFLPRVENRADFSRVIYEDLEPGGTFDITVTGSKGDLRGLSKVGIRCEPLLESGRFEKNMGFFEHELHANELNLPETLSVDFGNNSEIRVDYVRFETEEFDISVPEVKGTPIDGFQLLKNGVKVTPSRVQIRYPADIRPKIILLKPVQIDNRASSFNIEAELDREGLDPEVSLLSRPIVEVILVPEKASFETNVPLHLSGPSGVTSRLELLTTMIKVTVVGSETAVQAIRDDTSNLLYAFVVVQLQEAQLEIGEQHSLREIHCVVRKSRYASEVQIIPMSDTQDPGNREVIVKVMK